MVAEAIAEDWKKENILDNSTLKARIGWQGLTTAEYLGDGDYFLVGGTDFKKGRIDWDNCFFVSENRYNQDPNIKLEKGDVLVTKDGTIGKIAFVDKLTLPATLNSGVFVIRPKNDNYVSQYLFYILTSNYFDKFLNKLKAGSTISHLYQKDFVSFDFILPELKEEQQAIAQALSETDELIESLNKLITKKKNLKQGVMQELLTGKKRLPGFSGEWETKKLGDAVDFMKGSGLSKTKVSPDGKNKCLLYGELFTTYKEVIKDVVSKTNCDEGTLSKFGDILMPGSTTTVGIDLAVASALLQEAIYLGGDVNILRKKDDSFNSEFLANYLTHVRKHKIAEITQGTTIIHLYGRNLKDLEITIPNNKEEQTAIAKVLSDMDSDIEELEQKRDKYQMIKKGMMQQLLTGRIRLKWKN